MEFKNALCVHLLHSRVEVFVYLFGKTKVTHVIGKSQFEGHGCNNILYVIH